MTVEQLEIVITANSDDLDAKLAAVNIQLEEFEKNAAEIFEAFDYNINENIPDSGIQAAIAANGAGVAHAAKDNVETAATKSVDNAVINDISAEDLNENLNKTIEIPNGYYENTNNMFEMSYGYPELIVKNYQTSAGGMAENIPSLLIGGVSQSSEAKKAAEQAVYNSGASGDIHISVEVDGDVLAEAVAKNQIKKTIRTNGMTE